MIHCALNINFYWDAIIYIDSIMDLPNERRGGIVMYNIREIDHEIQNRKKIRPPHLIICMPMTPSWYSVKIETYNANSHAMTRPDPNDK